MYHNTLQPMIINKRKQKEGAIQDEEVFLYKPYTISLEPSRLKTPKLIFIQKEVNNLEKALKMLQSPMKTIPFFLLPHYKAIQHNGEKDWKEITAEFIKQKHNSDTS